MRGTVSRFPESYAALDQALLLEAYAGGPARIQAGLAGLSPEMLRSPVLAGKWTILEIALHVADSELVGAVRIRMVLASDEPPLLPGYDQDRWSRGMRYAEASERRLGEALTLFESIRASTCHLLNSLTSEDWVRTGIHPEHGSLTLRNILELYADHSERHLAQILERRTLLGCPVDLPLLLPERLY